MSNVVPLHRGRSNAEPWLSKRQAAKHLGVSVSWVEKRAADSSLPFRRVAGVNLYRASELDAWVERMHAAS